MHKITEKNWNFTTTVKITHNDISVSEVKLKTSNYHASPWFPAQGKSGIGPTMQKMFNSYFYRKLGSYKKFWSTFWHFVGLEIGVSKKWLI